MRRLLFALMVVSCATCLAQPQPQPTIKDFIRVQSPVIALEHVRVIDGTGAAEIVGIDDQTAWGGHAEWVAQHQAPGKHQAPSSKLQRNFKHQTSVQRRRFWCFDVWSFSGAWSLVLGAFW